MVKTFFENFETPFGFVFFYINHLQGRFVINRMSRKISKISHPVDRFLKPKRKSFLWVCLILSHLAKGRFPLPNLCPDNREHVKCFADNDERARQKPSDL